MPKLPSKEKPRSFLGSSFGEALEKMQSGKQEKANPADALPHLVVRALAGTGKTTTMIEGLRLMIEGKTSLSPNDQQADIWEQLLKSSEAKSICMVAFNKEIADELEKRIPKSPTSSHPSCVAMTLHSLGNRAIRSALGHCALDHDKSKRVLAAIRKITYEELLSKSSTFAYEVSELVSKCKLHFFNEVTDDNLDWINENYSLDFDLKIEHDLAVDAVLKASKLTTNIIDYEDMIWLPLVNDRIELPKYDLLIIDEGHDLDHSQQEMVMRIGRRIIFVADENQSIYAFRGSDSQSYKRMTQRLKNNKETIELPLTVTYRCSKAVVREAQEWVPDIIAAEDAVEGLVSRLSYEEYDNDFSCPRCKKERISYESNGWEHCLRCDYKWRMPKSYHSLVQDGDMVICRNNAPLVEQCLKFIKDGRKAYIRGRKDIAKGLTKLIKRLVKGRETFDYLESQLLIWRETELAKAEEKKDERQISFILDRFDCISHFMKDISPRTVWALITKIENLFNDKEKKGIMLGTIHQVKGLEADNVFFLMPKGAECPAVWAKGEQQEQEFHCRYIGITRCKINLYYVS